MSETMDKAELLGQIRNLEAALEQRIAWALASDRHNADLSSRLVGMTTSRDKWRAKYEAFTQCEATLAKLLRAAVAEAISASRENNVALEPDAPALSSAVAPGVPDTGRSAVDVLFHLWEAHGFTLREQFPEHFAEIETALRLARSVGEGDKTEASPLATGVVPAGPDTGQCPAMIHAEQRVDGYYRERRCRNAGNPWCRIYAPRSGGLSVTEPADLSKEHVDFGDTD